MVSREIPWFDNFNSLKVKPYREIEYRHSGLNLLRYKETDLSIPDREYLISWQLNFLKEQYPGLEEPDLIALLGYQIYNLLRSSDILGQETKKPRKIADWDVVIDSDGNILAVYMVYTGWTYSRSHCATQDKVTTKLYLKHRAENALESNGNLPAVLSESQFTIEEMRYLFTNDLEMTLLKDETGEDHVEIVRMALISDDFNGPYAINNPPRELDTLDATQKVNLLNVAHKHHSFTPKQMSESKHFGHFTEDQILISTIGFTPSIQIAIKDYSLSIIIDGGTNPDWRKKGLMTANLEQVLNVIYGKNFKTVVIGDVDARNEAMLKILDKHGFHEINRHLWVVGEKPELAGRNGSVQIAV